MSRKKLLGVVDIIKRAKIALGLKTDTQLAKLLDVKQSTIPAWKRRGNIDLAALVTLCNNVSADWLIHGIGEINPAAQDEDDITEKINMMLKDMDIDQRRDVLKYAEKEELFKKMKELYKERAA
jgi:hypothetical protein